MRFLDSKGMAFGLLSLAASVPASGQDFGGYYGGMAYNGMITNQTAITQAGIGRNLTQEARRGSTLSRLSEASESVVDAPALSFQPSLTARRQNYARFVAKTRAVDPAGADGLAANLKLDPIALMKPQLAQVGLRVDNVADAYAAYWIEAWEAVHGVTGQTSREKAEAVKGQSANAILATPAFATATPAQKQELAEAMLVQAMLVAAAREQANGDKAKLAEIGRAVEKGATASGFDLRAMTLTEEGFGPARKTGAADPAPGAEPQGLAATAGEDARPGYGFLAAAGGAGLGAAFLLGKAMARKG
ncbi:DUF6683 family protein [uncultured Sphingomonas sp.]|uniref:DUF6683 family protein n=1 Tax=uncultured Sphingomonas sp. TaxID=158754 RepID=UPI0035CA0F06